MKTTGARVLGLALSGALFAGGVMAREGAGGKDATQTLSRKEAVYELVLKWGPAASRDQNRSVRDWAGAMLPLFRTADLANLNSALSAKSYPEMISTLVGIKSTDVTKLPGGIAPASLGSSANDLVFTPLASCNLLDTRIVGGAFTAGTVRNYKASGPNFTAQGGSNTNCGIPAGVNSLVVSVSAISPTSIGYFRLWPYGTTQPAASNISYGPGHNIQNNLIMATSVGLTADFSVQSSAGSHLVVNVLGYFAAPIATALQCTNVSGTAVNIVAGANGQAFAGACASGYTETAIFCQTGNYDTDISNIGTSYGCTFKNNSGSTVSAVAISRCCRVPGR